MFFIFACLCGVCCNFYVGSSARRLRVCLYVSFAQAGCALRKENGHDTCKSHNDISCIVRHIENINQ